MRWRGAWTSDTLGGWCIRRCGDLYAPVIFRRHSFWTLCRGLAVVVASGSPLVRILHSCDPYRRVGLTTAVYKSRKFRADGPHVEVAILARVLETASLLWVACVICSFQMRPGSSYTSRTLIALSYTFTLWLLICTIDVRFSRAWRLLLIKWINWYLSEANFAPCFLAQASHCAYVAVSVRQFYSALAP
jgi:hypothetical protein